MRESLDPIREEWTLEAEEIETHLEELERQSRKPASDVVHSPHSDLPCDESLDVGMDAVDNELSNRISNPSPVDAVATICDDSAQSGSQVVNQDDSTCDDWSIVSTPMRRSSERVVRGQVMVDDRSELRMGQGKSRILKRIRSMPSLLFDRAMTARTGLKPESVPVHSKARCGQAGHTGTATKSTCPPFVTFPASTERLAHKEFVLGSGSQAHSSAAEEEWASDLFRCLEDICRGVGPGPI